MIRMVATDIDGTILKWSREFSPQVKECIKNLCENDIKVVLVTGRMHCAATPIARELDLHTPIVSYQGGLIKDENGKTLYQKDLPADYAKEIIKWAQNKDIHLNLYIDDKLYVEQDNEIVKDYTDGRFISYTVQPFDSMVIENVNKLLAIDMQDADRVTGWVDELSSIYKDLYIVKSTPYFCEIGSKEARKSSGVKFLADMWGIKKDEILTIGDQNNDIELLKAGGTAVAMGNSTDDLKQCADFVTDTVENDGFVKAIEKFVKLGVKDV